MAKRVIQECDLTKREYDPDQTVTIVIKKQGKKTGRTYELSAEAAAKLEQQLVAGPEAQLPEDWGFVAATAPVATEGSPRPRPKRTLGDLENEDVKEAEDEAFDEKAIAAKRASLKEAGVIAEEEEAPVVDEEHPAPPPSSVRKDAKGRCTHLNKGRVQVTVRKGKRVAYRKCTACRAEIPESSSDDKKSYMSGRTPEGVNLRSID
jgi:hypothetical protein